MRVYAWVHRSIGRCLDEGQARWGCAHPDQGRNAVEQAPGDGCREAEDGVYRIGADLVDARTDGEQLLSGNDAHIKKRERARAEARREHWLNMHGDGMHNARRSESSQG